MDLAGRCVIVTGAAGTIGRRVVAGLAGGGATVIAAARQSQDTYSCPNVTWICGDLLEYEVQEKVFENAQRERGGEFAFVHLAALPLQSSVEENQEQAVMSNAVLPWRLFTRAQKLGCWKFLLASTAAVYPMQPGLASEERTLPAPKSFYAATKLAAEALCRGGASSGRTACEVVRISNVYGPDSAPTTVFGRILEQVRMGLPIRVNSVSPIRDFIYIDDVAEGLMRILTASDHSSFQVTNLSSGVGTSVRALVDAVGSTYGVGCEVHDADRASPNDCLVIENHLLYSRTGWRPAHSLVEGLLAIRPYIRKDV